jgi:hypothetical protein
MNRFCKYLPQFVAALAGAITLGAPTQARADFELRYSINGGSFVTIGTTANNPGSISGSVDGINIIGTASDLLMTAISKIDLSVSGTLNTSITSLVIQASVTDVPTQPPPQTLSWVNTSSSDPGTGEKAQGWVNSSNLLYAMTGVTTGPLTAPASGSTSFSYSSAYSWTVQYSVGALGFGTALSDDNKETVSPSPAPAGLYLALSGAPVLGLAWLRRRRIS